MTLTNLAIVASAENKTTAALLERAYAAAAAGVGSKRLPFANQWSRNNKEEGERGGAGGERCTPRGIGRGRMQGQWQICGLK